MENSRADKIYLNIKEKTIRFLQDGMKADNTDALNIGLDLKIDRSNVSRELNRLWKNGKLIKIQGKPVYYLDYEELSSHYPDAFFPTVISKDEQLSDFIGKSEKSVKQSNVPLDSIDQIIGATGSLSDVILRAKAAVTYPPYGIHCLIYGRPGVGKTELAGCMIKFAEKERGKKVPYETVYCQEFQNNTGLFQDTLLGKRVGGNKVKEGLLKKLDYGILILDEVGSLNIQEQKFVISLLQDEKFLPAGSNIPVPLNTMIICTTRHKYDDEQIDSIKNSLPVHLHLLDIDDRAVYEKIELVLSNFSREALRIHVAIRVHKDVIAALSARKYRNNISEMRNEIQNICSRAYFESPGKEIKTVYVTLQHLTQELINQSEAHSVNTANVISLLSCIPSEYLRFEADGFSQDLTIFHQAPDVFNDHRVDQFVDEFDVNTEDLNNIDGYVSDNINVLKNCPPAQLEALRKKINPFVYQITIKELNKHHEYLELLNNPQLLFGALIHISNYLKRVENGDVASEHKESVTKQIYVEEYKVAENIYRSIGSFYNFNPTEREIDFITSYLAIAKRWSMHAAVSILLICHGKSVATEMASYIRNNYQGNYSLDYIDFHEHMQLNDLLELSLIKAGELNKGAGILICCDMEPLTSVGDVILKKMHIPTRTIRNISLPTLINIVAAVSKTFNDLDSLEARFASSSFNSIDKDNSSFLDQVRDNIIAKTVSFLDTNKAVSILETCLRNTLKELDIPYSDAIAVKYICHCTNMLERVISKETWNYQKINSFSNDNSYIMHVVEHNLEYAEDSFGIKIPATEIAYVTEIFLPEYNS